MNKSAKIYESESIVERIEMSQSINQRVPIMSKVAGNSQSLGRGSKQPLLNNFIAPTPAPNYDPFSIINIMVNRQIPPKQVNQQSPVKLDRSAKHQPV
jgi:hypothetical protein